MFTAQQAAWWLMGSRGYEVKTKEASGSWHLHISLTVIGIVTMHRSHSASGVVFKWVSTIKLLSMCIVSSHFDMISDIAMV